MTIPTNILVVEARFYADIADMLVEGAASRIEEAGASWDRIEVPGAFEIPGVIKYALDRYDGFVALGCVIRGETTHYDYVCVESARGLMDLAVREGASIGYGILTVHDRNQALARASVEHKNKGRVAAEACLRMIELKRAFANESG